MVLEQIEKTKFAQKNTKDTILVTELYRCHFHIHSYTRLINSKKKISKD